MSNLISAAAWVRRGVSARNPKKYVLDEDELTRVSTLARTELEDARTELERVSKLAKTMGKDIEEDDGDDQWEDEPSGAGEAADDDVDGMDVDQKPQSNDPNDLSQYNLDNYDEETTGIASGPFSNIKGLTYYRDNEDDPYITLKEDEEDEEREELEVLPTDNLIVVGKTEDDVSHLEVYLYDESEDNLYVHHDLMLPSFPLCLEWLDYKPGSSSTDSTLPGNYIAVGTFDPEIEIWSLDTVDGLYPDGILGRPDKSREHIPVPLGTGKKKRKKEKPRKLNPEYHVDAVLGLSWNRSHRNLLASASADKSVKLWDLARDNSPAIRSFDVHKDKVQAVTWNPDDPTVLLTGSHDRTVRMFDTRAPTGGVGAVLGADVEALRWDPWEPHSFYVSLDNGLVLNFDARTLPSDIDQPSPARFTLSAHDGAVAALDVNPHVRGCIATGGVDKVVKVWNIDESGGNRAISLVTSRDLGVGKVFTVAWSPDDPLTLVAGGSKSQLQIWEVGQNMGVRRAFKAKLAQAGKELKEKQVEVVGLADDDEEGESGEEE